MAKVLTMALIQYIIMYSRKKQKRNYTYNKSDRSGV